MAELGSQRHSAWMNNLAVLIVVSTICSVIIGWLWPGPGAGLGMPLSLTAWWLLYRIILWRERRDG